jgi:hypothetical protein
MAERPPERGGRLTPGAVAGAEWNTGTEAVTGTGVLVEVASWAEAGLAKAASSRQKEAIAGTRPSASRLVKSVSVPVRSRGPAATSKHLPGAERLEPSSDLPRSPLMPAPSLSSC